MMWCAGESHESREWPGMFVCLFVCFTIGEWAILKVTTYLEQTI